MNRFRKSFSTVVYLGLFVTGMGCAKKDAASTVSVAAAITGAQAKLALAIPSTKYTYAGGTRALEESTRSAFGSVWTTDGILSNLGNGGGVSGLQNLSPKNWMGSALDPNFQNSNHASVTVFGRFKSAVGIACAIGAKLPAGTDGLPVVGSGSFSVTPTDAALTTCGMTTQSAFTINYTVTATTVTTLFDRKITIDPGGTPNTIYFGLKTDGSVNIANWEDNSAQSPARTSRTVYLYNGTKKTLRFEYDSQSFPASGGGYEFYRAYGDLTANQGWVIGNYGSGDNSNYIRYSLAGQPTTGAGTTVALSMAWVGQSVTSSAADLNACIDRTTGSVSTDNSLACTVTGTPVSSATVIGTNQTAHTSVASYSIGETTDLPFTDQTTMLTAN